MSMCFVVNYYVIILFVMTKVICEEFYLLNDKLKKDDVYKNVLYYMRVDDLGYNENIYNKNFGLVKLYLLSGYFLSWFFVGLRIV